MKQSIYIPVSLRLIKWEKETIVDNAIVKEPKSCYAHTTARGRVMNIAGADMNTTTTMKINGVDITSASSGLDYAKWYWDMNSDIYNEMLNLGFGNCYIKLTYQGTLDNVVDEELITTDDYQALQDKPSFDDYLQAQAV